MKKCWKMIAIVLMSLVMVLTFAGCKKSTPSESVDKELKDLQSETVKDVDLPYINEENADDNELKDNYVKWINMIQKFDYKIIDEKISKDGKSATVRVKISTYNFGEAYNEVAKQIKNDIDEGKINKDTNIDNYVISEFLPKALALKDKEYTKEIIIKCKKEKKEWKNDIYENEDFKDSILGGMLTEAPNLTSFL